MVKTLFSGSKFLVFYMIPIGMERLTASNDLSLFRKYDLNHNETVVFYIGNLTPWHDLNTLMESISYVSTKLVLIIAGGRNVQIQNQAKRYSSEKARVVFADRLEPKEVSSYLSLADICVAPYRFSPSGFFPGKVIKYMLAGKAIVATDIPEIREMFQNREAGLLVPQENPRALAEALDCLAQDSGKRSKLGAAAKEIAESNYLTHHHIEQLLRVFREVM